MKIGITYHGRTHAEGKKINWKDGVKALWYLVKFRFRSVVLVDGHNDRVLQHHGSHG